jgi:hypothetical protein
VAYSSHRWSDVEHCHLHRKAEVADSLALPVVFQMVMVGEHRIGLVSVLLDRNLQDRVLGRLERNPWVAEAVGRVKLLVIVNLERPYLMPLEVEFPSVKAEQVGGFVVLVFVAAVSST